MYNCLNLDIYLHNVNAINASILPQNAERNPRIRLIICTKLLMMNNNARMPLSKLYKVNAITVSIMPQS